MYVNKDVRKEKEVSGKKRKGGEEHLRNGSRSKTNEEVREDAIGRKSKEETFYPIMPLDRWWLPVSCCLVTLTSSCFLIPVSLQLWSDWSWTSTLHQAHLRAGVQRCPGVSGGRSYRPAAQVVHTEQTAVSCEWPNKQPIVVLWGWVGDIAGCDITGCEENSWSVTLIWIKSGIKLMFLKMIIVKADRSESLWKQSLFINSLLTLLMTVK